MMEERLRYIVLRGASAEPGVPNRLCDSDKTQLGQARLRDKDRHARNGQGTLQERARARAEIVVEAGAFYTRGQQRLDRAGATTEKRGNANPQTELGCPLGRHGVD